MNQLHIVAFVFVAGLASHAHTPSPQRPATPAPAPPHSAGPGGNVEQGKKLYVSYGCYQCHGYEAQGSIAGSRLGPRPIPYAAFARYVRQPTGQMPLYTTKVVSESELGHIYAFVQSRPTPPPAATIPLLR